MVTQSSERERERVRDKERHVGQLTQSDTLLNFLFFLQQHTSGRAIVFIFASPPQWRQSDTHPMFSRLSPILNEDDRTEEECEYSDALRILVGLWLGVLTFSIAGAAMSACHGTHGARSPTVL